MPSLVPARLSQSPDDPLTGCPQGPRGDSLLRAVVAALVDRGYHPVERQSTDASSCVRLRRAAGAPSAPAARLQVTHLPCRHCLLLELFPPGAWSPKSAGRRIYWYYQAQQLDDRARIAAGLAASIAIC